MSTILFLLRYPNDLLTKILSFRQEETKVDYSCGCVTVNLCCNLCDTGAHLHTLTLEVYFS